MDIIYLDDFNAKSARELAINTDVIELNEVLYAIRREAEIGKFDLTIKKPLKEKTIQELNKRSFVVYQSPSYLIQTENNYYSITWR
jgi:hypothetical protein